MSKRCPFKIRHYAPAFSPCPRRRNEDKTLGNHVMKKGESLVTRYEVVLHHGSLESSKLPDVWKVFSKNP